MSAPIFKLRKKYRIRLLIRGPKTLKMQNSLAIVIPKFKFLSGIKLSVDVDQLTSIKAQKKQFLVNVLLEHYICIC